MSKIILSFLFIISVIANAQRVPERLEGTITDVYCGAYKEYQKPQSNDIWKDACVLFLKDLGKAVVFHSNGYIQGLVPSDEDNSVIIGREVRFSSCEVLDEEEAVEIKKYNFPSSFQYIQCYENYTELVTPNSVAMKPEVIAGNYANARGNKARVETEIIVQATLFSPAIFSIEVEYIKASKDNTYDSISIGYYNRLSSNEFLYVNNSNRPYFLSSYSDDCDDADCYNTDGIIKFLKNKKGDYTLYLQFSHYNNAPMEYGDEFDYEESVFLKKIK